MTEKKERTFTNLVVERSSQRVVGAHMIGPDAGEIIQDVTVAVKLGATKQRTVLPRRGHEERADQGRHTQAFSCLS